MPPTPQPRNLGADRIYGRDEAPSTIDSRDERLDQLARASASPKYSFAGVYQRSSV
jgi:hypothetical protein